MHPLLLLLVPRLAAKENLTSRLVSMPVGTTKTANTFQLLSVGSLSLFKPL